MRIRAQIKPSAAAGTLANTASLSAQSPTDPTSANDSDTVNTTVSRSADLAVDKSGPATANAGEYISYRIDVSNNGPSDGTSATLTDTLSSSLQNATYCVDSGPACDPSLGSAWGGTLAVGALNSGATKTVRIRAQIKPSAAAGTLANTASLSAQSPTDPTSANDSDTVNTTVSRSADLAVDKSGPATANAGEYISYRIDVSNNGPSDGTSATLTDTLSSSLQNATYCVDSGPACDPSLGSAWGGTLAVGALNSGATKTVRIRAQIKPSAAAGTLANTASLSAQSPTDPTSANDSDTVNTTVSRSADLAVDKSGPATANAGEYISYRIDVSNNGPSDGTSATLTDTLSSSLQNATYCVDSGPACDPSLGSAWGGTLAVGALNSGATKTVRIRAQIKPSAAAGTLANTASLSAQSPTDPTSANDSDTVNTTVSRSADLAVDKSGPATANAGEYISYRIDVSNNGPSDGTSATLTDTLSSSLQNATYCVDSGPACDPSLGSAWAAPWPSARSTAAPPRRCGSAPRSSRARPPASSPTPPHSRPSRRPTRPARTTPTRSTRPSAARPTWPSTSPARRPPTRASTSATGSTSATTGPPTHLGDPHRHALE